MYLLPQVGCDATVPIDSFSSHPFAHPLNMPSHTPSQHALSTRARSLHTLSLNTHLIHTPIPQRTPSIHSSLSHTPSIHTRLVKVLQKVPPPRRPRLLLH